MILCIDIGGTSAKMALMERDGTVLDRASISTCVDEYHVPLLDCVVSGAADFLSRTGASPEGIGVSATGQIDTRTGVVVGTGGNIPNYEGAPVKAALEERFGIPVHVLNDANAATLGECFHGCAAGKRCVVMITLGTGVGGGIVLDGKVFGGIRGIAGEIGHTTLHAHGIPCACGKSGCLESYASAKALVAMARAETGEEGINGKIIFDRAGQGDRLMLSLLDRWTDEIAEGASSLIHIFNPDMLVIGGGVSVQTELLLNPLRRKILARTMREFAKDLEITGAALGNDAGLYGALKNWMDRQEEKRL